MELNLITEKELEGKGVIGQPDVPGLSTEEMQEKVEEIVRSVAIVKINEIIEYLKEKGATKEDLEDIVVAAGAVTSVHGRRGNVIGQPGDYTAEMVGAAREKHASEHLPGGRDPINLAGLNAAAKDHTHGNITNDGRIGSANGKILMTGYNGSIEAKDKTELGFAVEPELVATSGTVSITVADNKEYEYTGVTRLTMAAADAECHGTVTFGSTAPTVSVTGFKAQGGDDITKAAARETWEFTCFKKLIIWKNWGVV